MSVHVVILAAGEGTRMKAGRPKVLQEVAGRAMVHWAIAAARGASPDRIIAVVGHGADDVAATLPQDVEPVLQAQQLGTGHATAVAIEALGPGPDDTVVVLPGDAPLITAEMVGDLVAGHGGNAATLLTTRLADPTGYGRVMRSDDGLIAAIVEEPDATPDQRRISEVATSAYAFAASGLAEALSGVGTDNAKGEHYLTDVVAMLTERGDAVGAVAVDLGVVGVNSYDQLAEAAEVMRRRINGDWMRRGVMMLDPDRTYVDAAAVLAPGARILPGSHLEGSTTVGAGATVGPDCHITDSAIGPDAVVRYAVLESAEVQEGAVVGPFTYLRRGSVLGPRSKAGAHVEMKNSTLAAGAKVPHLSYIGDATVGEDANVGAGTITCNWDGFAKHHTTIGAGARIGSDTMLVAPVEIGEGAFTGAGSVISHDVSPGALAVERSPQKEIGGYAERRRKRAEADE
jgi:bifunctional UDP-N-acetylglucosamine pyrophosphorylase/glucosamine-1-phosphate N-acetyltransferase